MFPDFEKKEKVIAIGSPLGLINTVSSGIFSGNTTTDDIEALQFTASISNGSSGGALFNDNGEVIGVTFASYDAGQNLNLAIPIEKVISMWKTKSENTFITPDNFSIKKISINTLLMIFWKTMKK